MKRQRKNKQDIKNIIKANKAITLIALVVTIVVLLILAGVSISMLGGENGIIKQAVESKENTRGASAKEEVDLWKTNVKTDNITGSTTAETTDELLNRLKNNGAITEEEATKLKNGETITIGKSEISLDDESSGGVNSLPLPENAVISQIEGEYGNVDKGIVIYIMRDADDDGIIDEPNWNDPEMMQTTYDQFVWVPVPNAVLDLSNNSEALSSEANIKAAVQGEIDEGRYPMAIKKDATNYFGVLYQFSLDSTTNTVKVEPDSSWTPLTTLGNREPSAVTRYDTSSYLQQVNGILNTSYSDSTSFGNALQAEFNAMVNRVASKKGFWVGRYETSNMSNSTTTTYASSNEIKVNVVKGTTTGIRSVTWYRMYAQQKLYSSKANITLTSSMIWGSQWDQIMIWMKGQPNETSYAGTSPFYVINSQGMSNFGTSVGGTGSIANTGYYAVKNIYDLAGNVWDWTLEAYRAKHRDLRGGYYDSTDSSYARADYRVYSSPDSSNTSDGSRSTLY